MVAIGWLCSDLSASPNCPALAKVRIINTVSMTARHNSPPATSGGLSDGTPFAVISAFAGTILLTAIATVIGLLPGVAQMLQFDSSLIADGQWWRIVTGHFTHWNADHLFWDVLAFAVLGCMCEYRSRSVWLACLAGSALLIPLTLVIVRPEISLYRGLSGIDSALFVMAVIFRIQDACLNGDRPTVTLLAITGLGFGFKLAYEVTTGTTLFVDSHAAGFVPLVESHIAGAIAGTAWALLHIHRQHLRLTAAPD
jgi:rhomboid family GlyGly-CTERM serine protease